MRNLILIIAALALTGCDPSGYYRIVNGTVTEVLTENGFCTVYWYKVEHGLGGTSTVRGNNELDLKIGDRAMIEHVQPFFSNDCRAGTLKILQRDAL